MTDRNHTVRLKAVTRRWFGGWGGGLAGDWATVAVLCCSLHDLVAISLSIFNTGLTRRPLPPPLILLLLLYVKTGKSNKVFIFHFWLRWECLFVSPFTDWAVKTWGSPHTPLTFPLNTCCQPGPSQPVRRVYSDSNQWHSGLSRMTVHKQSHHISVTVASSSHPALEKGTISEQLQLFHGSVLCLFTWKTLN